MMTHTQKLLAFSALAILLTSGYPAPAHAEEGAPPAAAEDRPFEGGPIDRGPGNPRKGDCPQAGSGQGDCKSGQGGGGGMFAKADKDGDGFLTKEEMLDAHKARMDEMFTKTDTDNDGKLSPDEMRKGRESMREKFKERMQDMKEKRSEMREKMQERRGQGQGQGQSSSSDD